MAAKYILSVLAAAFLIAALLRLSRGGGSIAHPQTKTWLLISGIFAAVSAWLFSQG
jgi:pheromone shutdown protein TraB